MALALGAYTACLYDRPLGQALEAPQPNGLTSVEGAEMVPAHLMRQGTDVRACIRWLGPLVVHAAAKDAAITPGLEIRGVLAAAAYR